MILRALGLVVSLLLPAATAYLLGYGEFAHYLLLGAVLAFHLGVHARPLAPFGVLLPFVYAAAAITANVTGGVAALIVAVAAATGAASSLGYHRGMLAVLAAALIGSCEPAAVPVAVTRAAGVLAGSACGALLVLAVGRGLATRALAVSSRTALGYSLLLAVLVLLAWVTMRAVTIDMDEAWWLPLAVAALGEPWLETTSGRAVRRLVLALASTLMLLVLLEPIFEPMVRAACAVALMIALYASGPRRAWLHAFLFTPVLVLLAADERTHASFQYFEAILLAFGVVAAFTVLGKWLLWTVRPDSGHAAI